MKDKLISDFASYLQRSNIKNINVTSNSTEVNITTSLFNDRTFIDMSLVALAAYGTYNVDDKKFYLIPIIITWVVLIVIIWFDFNRINNIRVAFLSKKIQVASRNIFRQTFVKYILKDEKQFDFSNVDFFAVRSNFGSKADSNKYFVDARLKQGTIVTLTFLAREEQAHAFVSFLTTLIKN